MQDEDIKAIIEEKDRLTEELKKANAKIFELEDQVKTTVGLLIQDQMKGGTIGAELAKASGIVPSSAPAQEIPFSQNDYWKLADRITKLERDITTLIKRLRDASKKLRERLPESL